MARIRTLKPEWLEDEKLAALPDAARVLSVGLILLADDQGRGRANPSLIAGHVWPYAADQRKASTELDRLAELQFVTLYAVNGQQYYQIRNWEKHQKVPHPAAPRLPGPEQGDATEPMPVKVPKPPTWSPPEWIPAEAWAAFCDTRRKLRAPMTERAMQLIAGSLEKLRAEGHDPRRVLEQSVERGWKGVFPIGTNGSHDAKPSPRAQPPPASEVFKKWETT